MREDISGRFPSSLRASGTSSRRFVCPLSEYESRYEGEETEEAAEQADEGHAAGVACLLHDINRLPQVGLQATGGVASLPTALYIDNEKKSNSI